MDREPAQTLAALTARFGRPGQLAFSASPSGLIAAEITTELCRGRVFLHGAHVTDYQPAGQPPLLWVSSASLYQPGKAIRGGIPVCWPWFGNHLDDPAKPAHGFARTALWRLLAVDDEADGAIVLTLGLEDSPQALALWPHPFGLRLTITFGSTLRLSLSMENRDVVPVSISCALHTYFQVADWRTCRLHGLEDADYLDKVEGYARKHQPGVVTFSRETDRIYLLPDGACRIESPETGQDILIRQQGSTATVVWNPGPEKAEAMADMTGDEYRQMVCVETAIAPQVPILLHPGKSYVLTAEIGYHFLRVCCKPLCSVGCFPGICSPAQANGTD
jgi:glucose-6-phosphate 1-epimerase